MDTIRVKKYQERLLTRRGEILKTLSHLQEQSQEFIGRRHLDWLDQAWDESETRLLDRLSDEYARELRRVEMALGRVSAGTYGRCPACHEPIGRARLDIFPETEFCLPCQEMRERFEKAA